MNALLTGLMAIVGGGAGAPDTPPDTPLSDDAWIRLDQEIEQLAESLHENSGPEVGLLMRLNYASSSDFTIGGNDLGGILWDNIRLSVAGRTGAFEYFLQTESAAASVIIPTGILDAWIRTSINENLRLTMGLMPQPFLNSSGIEPQNLLFILRTANAQFWNSRDQSLMLDGTVGAIDWAVSAANGTDFGGDDLAYSGQVSVHALGGGLDQVQGAYGKGEDLRVTAIASYHENENAIDEGDVVALELAGSWGRWYSSLEHLQYGDDGLPGGAGVFSVASDTSPFSAVLSFMFVEDKYETAVRYQDLDDTFETEAFTVGVNRYFDGRNGMWQLNYINKTADLPGIDSQTVAVGFTVSI